MFVDLVSLLFCRRSCELKPFFCDRQVPGRTAVDMRLPAVVELAKHPRIIGLKDVSALSPKFTLSILRSG